VRRGFQAEDDGVARQQGRLRPQALEIQVRVNAAEAVEDEVARRVRAHDRFGVGVVDGQEPGVVPADELAVVRIRPEVEGPAGVMDLPGALKGGQSRRHVGVPPGLVDDPGNGRRW
jgi:hypothetical protein